MGQQRPNPEDLAKIKNYLRGRLDGTFFAGVFDADTTEEFRAEDEPLKEEETRHPKFKTMVIRPVTEADRTHWKNILRMIEDIEKNAL